MTSRQVLSSIANFEALNRAKRMTPSRNELRVLEFGELTGAILSLQGSKSFDQCLFVDLADYYLELSMTEVKDFCYDAALFSFRWSSRGDLADNFLHIWSPAITQDEAKWLHLMGTGIQKGFVLPQQGEIVLKIIKRESEENNMVSEETLFIAYGIMELWIKRNPGRLIDDSFVKMMRWSPTEMAFEQFLSSCLKWNRSFRILTAATFLCAQDDLYHMENSDAIDDFVLEVDGEVASVDEAAIAAKLVSAVLNSRPDSFDISGSRIDKLFVSSDSKFQSQCLLLLSRLYGTIVRTNRILQKIQLDPAEGVEIRKIVRKLEHIHEPYFEELTGYFKMSKAMGFLRDEETIETKLIRAFSNTKLRSSMRELIKEKMYANLIAGALHIIMDEEASEDFKAGWIRKLDFRGTVEEVKIQADALQQIENKLVPAKDAERLRRICVRWLTECQDESLRVAIYAIPMMKLCDF